MTILLREQLRLGPRISAEARDALGPLERRLRPEVLADLRLLVSELVTNSFRHAGLASGAIITLTIEIEGDRLRVEVEDGGRGFAVEPRPVKGVVRESGWGFTIVRAVADRWGIVRNGSTLVWCELQLRDAPMSSRRA